MWRNCDPQDQINAREGCQKLNSLRQRLPPIRIIDYDPASERTELWFFSGSSFRAHKIHNRNPTPADRYSFAILNGFNQLKKSILGIRYGNSHVLN
jgi:hypothetical protein